MLRRCLNLIGMFVTVWMLAACVTTGTDKNIVKERYFWPPLPDEPKLEWLGAYNSHLDLGNKTSKVLSFFTGEEDADGLTFPFAIAADGKGRAYVSDIGKFNVLVFDFINRDTHILAGGVLASLLDKPGGIDVDAQGNIYVGDMLKQKIVVFSREEKPLKVLELSGLVKSIGVFKVDNERKRLVIPDTKGHKIVIVDYDGKLLNSIELYDIPTPPGKDGFRFPNAVALEPNGTIVIADTVNARAVRLTPDGKFINTIGVRGENVGTVDFVKGIAVDSEGNIYMTDFRTERLQIFNAKGQSLFAMGDKSLKGDNIGTFKTPTTVYIDKNDTIYVTETTARRFQMLQYITKDYLARNPIPKDLPTGKILTTE